jgi:hypothetical protein
MGLRCHGAVTELLSRIDDTMELGSELIHDCPLPAANSALSFS